jgi:flagellar biosynthetic protein FliQ
MSDEFVFDLITSAMATTLAVAGPLLVTALIVGIVISVIQAVTQIQEQTLTFVPKLGAIAFVIFALMPWLMQQLVSFLIEVLQAIPMVVT